VNFIIECLSVELKFCCEAMDVIDVHHGVTWSCIVQLFCLSVL
jgi:hypothetical protein